MNPSLLILCIWFPQAFFDATLQIVTARNIDTVRMSQYIEACSSTTLPPLLSFASLTSPPFSSSCRSVSIDP
ncbi:hypothetical protein ACFX13_028987 [Malus domestica]